MCLISICPKGTEKLNDKVENFIKQGLSSNTDGSGIMWKKDKDNKVNIKKGLKTFDDIKKAIEEANLTLEDELIIHHRIGTSGERNEINTHPFIVSEDYSVIKQIEGSFNLPAMAHNGVFYSYTNYNSKFNDTFHFTNEFIAIPEVLSLLKNKTALFKELFTPKLGTNKLAFLFPDRDLLMIGNFVTEDGYYHSNGGYKKFVYDKGGSSSYYNMNNFKKHEANKNLELFDNKEIEKPLIENTSKLTSLKFLYDDIKLTNKNLHHFLLVRKVKSDIFKYIELNVSYEINSKVEDTYYLCEYPKNKILYGVSGQNGIELLKNCDFHVKQEYEQLYKSINALIRITSRSPSKSTLGKIKNVLDRSTTKSEIKYKNYGILNKEHLQHFYNKYSLKNVNREIDYDTTINCEIV